MGSKKDDRRVKYTKTVLKDSFITLLEKRTSPKFPSRSCAKMPTSTARLFIPIIMTSMIL